MRNYFTERSLVVILFIAALVVFAFASEDARKLEARNFQVSSGRFSPPSPQVVELPSGSAPAARD